MKKLLLLFTVLTLVLMPMAAMATVSYDFVAICDSSEGCPTGAAQFKVDVSQVDDSVLFHFYNTGPNPSFMAQIYFYENATSTLLDYSSVEIENGSGVKFVAGDLSSGNPNLPCIKDYLKDPTISPKYFAEAESPGTNKDGVDPYEYVNFTIPLTDSFDAVLAALNFGPNYPEGGILLGIHGQGLCPDLGSCSYVQTTPIPGSLLLLGTGILGLVGLRRKL